MRKKMGLVAVFVLLVLFPAFSLASTRALLIACSNFVSQPDLGNAVSGNLQMLGSVWLGAQPRLAGLSIEDGTIGTQEALDAAIHDAFDAATEEDLSILYLCTHGILPSSDDQSVYLLLGDGQTESMLTGSQLYEMIAGIQGEKLLILDACFSGALIGRGSPFAQNVEDCVKPFLADPSVHVLTSANGFESSWYFDSEGLSTGAISYFASALTSGLGLYGTLEADLNGDDQVSLSELHHYLNVAVPSSSSQLLSASADTLMVPSAQGAMLSRPLTGFSYGDLLLLSDEPTLDFSFTVTQETSVQYRLVDYDAGRWNWENAQVFLDEESLLTPGRKTRTLTLSDIAPHDSGYLMLQVFALQGEELILCSERLIAVQPAQSDARMDVKCPPVYTPGTTELPISVHLNVPAEVTVSVFNSDGELVRRLCTSQLTRPTPDQVFTITWDGRDSAGNTLADGLYNIAAEARIGTSRQKSSVSVQITGSPHPAF